MRASFDGACKTELGLAQGELTSKLISEQVVTPLTPENINRMQEQISQHHLAITSVVALTEKVVPYLDEVIALYTSVLNGEYPVEKGESQVQAALCALPYMNVPAVNTVKSIQPGVDFDLVKFAHSPDGYINEFIASGLKDPHADNTAKHTFLLSHSPPLLKYFLLNEVNIVDNWDGFTKKARAAFKRAAAIDTIIKERNEVAGFVDCNSIFKLRKMKYGNVCSEVNIFSSICTVAQQQVIVEALVKEGIFSMTQGGLARAMGRLPTTSA
ncbi:hypothetical protein EC988_000362 [Linderina pennispora]|nr:hypothetical protein EC988_000362 [Linderina pennispora]